MKDRVKRSAGLRAVVGGLFLSTALPFLLFPAVSAAPISAPLPRTFLAAPADLAANAAALPGAAGSPLAEAYAWIRGAASSLLAVPDTANPTVTNKTMAQVPPNATINDYVSLAPYWWPDPKSPTGMPFNRVDGCGNPNAVTNDKTAWRVFVEGTSTLALASYFAGVQPALFPESSDAYAKRALSMVNTFLVDPATRMIPRLDFAQARLGRETAPFQWSTDVVASPELLDALGILEATPVWTDAVKSGSREFWKNLGAWLNTKTVEAGEKASQNNIRSTNEVIQLAIRLYLGESVTPADAIAKCEDRYLNQIADSGEQFEETARSDSWWYSMMNTVQLIRLARLSDRVSSTPDKFGGGPCWTAKPADFPEKNLVNAANYMVPPMLLDDICYWPNSVRFSTSQRVDTAINGENMYLLYRATGNTTYLYAAVNAMRGLDNMNSNSSIWWDLAGLTPELLAMKKEDHWPAGLPKPNCTNWASRNDTNQTVPCRDALSELYKGTAWQGYELGGWPVLGNYTGPVNGNSNGGSGSAGGSSGTGTKPSAGSRLSVGGLGGMVIAAILVLV